MWPHNENANGVPVPAIRFNFSSFDTASGTLVHLSFPATCRSSETSRLTGAIWTFVRRKVIVNELWKSWRKSRNARNPWKCIELSMNKSFRVQLCPIWKFFQVHSVPVTVLNPGICIYSIVSRSTGKHTPNIVVQLCRWRLSAIYPFYHDLKPVIHIAYCPNSIHFLSSSVSLLFCPFTCI